MSPFSISLEQGWRRLWVVTARAMRRAKLQSKPSPATNQHPAFNRLDDLPVVQARCESTEGKDYHTSRTWSPQADLGIFEPWLDYRSFPVTLGSSRASRQPSDASPHVSQSMNPIWNSVLNKHLPRTAWWQRHTCVDNLPGVALSSATLGKLSTYVCLCHQAT